MVVISYTKYVYPIFFENLQNTFFSVRYCEKKRNGTYIKYMLAILKYKNYLNDRILRPRQKQLLNTQVRRYIAKIRNMVYIEYYEE